jgi:hypothetical protein
MRISDRHKGKGPAAADGTKPVGDAVRSRAGIDRLAAACAEMAADRDHEPEAPECLDAVSAPLDDEERTMKYKDYFGTVTFEDDQGILYGEVIGTRRVATFQGGNLHELRTAFQKAVDDYLALCGEDPDSD